MLPTLASENEPKNGASTHATHESDLSSAQQMLPPTRVLGDEIDATLKFFEDALRVEDFETLAKRFLQDNEVTMTTATTIIPTLHLQQKQGHMLLLRREQIARVEDIYKKVSLILDYSLSQKSFGQSSEKHVANALNIFRCLVQFNNIYGIEMNLNSTTTTVDSMARRVRGYLSKQHMAIMKKCEANALDEFREGVSLFERTKLIRAFLVEFKKHSNQKWHYNFIQLLMSLCGEVEGILKKEANKFDGKEQRVFDGSRIILRLQQLQSAKQAREVSTDQEFNARVHQMYEVLEEHSNKQLWNLSRIEVALDKFLELRYAWCTQKNRITFNSFLEVMYGAERTEVNYLEEQIQRVLRIFMQANNNTLAISQETENFLLYVEQCEVCQILPDMVSEIRHSFTRNLKHEYMQKEIKSHYMYEQILQGKAMVLQDCSSDILCAYILELSTLRVYKKAFAIIDGNTRLYEWLKKLKEQYFKQKNNLVRKNSLYAYNQRIAQSFVSLDRILDVKFQRLVSLHKKQQMEEDIQCKRNAVSLDEAPVCTQLALEQSLNQIKRYLESDDFEQAEQLKGSISAAIQKNTSNWAALNMIRRINEAISQALEKSIEKYQTLRASEYQANSPNELLSKLGRLKKKPQYGEAYEKIRRAIHAQARLEALKGSDSNYHKQLYGYIPNDIYRQYAAKHP